MMEELTEKLSSITVCNFVVFLCKIHITIVVCVNIGAYIECNIVWIRPAIPYVTCAERTKAESSLRELFNTNNY